MIFDTHSHYTSHQFDADRTALLDSLPAQGVCAVVDCGTDYATTLKSLELARQYPWFYTAAGIHPESLIEEDASTNTQFGGDWRAELAQLETLLSDPRVVAVGECGLDYHWPVPKDAQLAMFEAHLELANKHDMPVLVHDREAHADTYALLAQYRPKGIVHCFSGSAPDAVRLAEQGMYIGFGGVLTFANARKTVEGRRRCAAGAHCAGNRLPVYGACAVSRQALRLGHDSSCSAKAFGNPRKTRGRNSCRHRAKRTHAVWCIIDFIDF